MGLVYGTNNLHLFFNWFAIAATFPLVLTRLYTRIVTRCGWRSLFHAKAWCWSDILVVLAWSLSLLRGIEHSICIRFYKHARNGILPFGLQIQLAKIQYIIMAIYWLPLYIVKVAILLLYNEFTPRSWRGKWWSPIIVTGALCVVGCLASELIYFFGCLPISIRWTPNSPAFKKCVRDRFMLFYVLMEVFHIFTDLAVFVIPFYILHTVRNTITSRQKCIGRLMFTLGLCSLASSITMCVLNLYNGAQILMPVIAVEPSPELLLYNYATFVEQTSALVVVCIPNLRQYIHDRHHRFSTDQGVSELDVERNSGLRLSESDSDLDAVIGQRVPSISNTSQERPISLKALHLQRAWSQTEDHSSLENVEEAR